MGDTSNQKPAGLLRHDRTIVANELRAALSSWSDWLIALASVLGALVALRQALSHRPFIVAASVVVTVSVTGGAGTALLMARRLDFHAEDGVLAAEVWAAPMRRHYIWSIHTPVCTMATMVALIGRPTTAALAPIGYLIGASVCHAAYRMMPRGATRRGAPTLRVMRPLLHRPLAGAVAAASVILFLLLFRSFEPDVTAAFVALISAVAALCFTTLDYDIVRFMTESGYSSGRIIGIHARSLVMFVVPTVVASVVLSDRGVAVVIVGVVVVALVLMTSRILAYRIHTKRTGDILVSIFAGVASVTAIMLPLFLPVVVMAMLWHLYHRARPATWLLT